MAVSSADAVMIQPQHQAEASAQRSAHQALPRGGADGGEVRNGDGVRARAGPGADQNIHAKIFQRGVEDLLHVRKQAMNLVDEENLARPDVGEHAGEIELLLENRARRFVRNPTPSSAAMMVASVVLPKPGGP